MQYILISDDSEFVFTNTVNDYLSKGWELHGELHIIKNVAGLVFTRELILKKSS